MQDGLRFLKAQQDLMEIWAEPAQTLAEQSYGAGLRHNDLKPLEISGALTLNHTNVLLFLKRKASKRGARWRSVADSWLAACEQVRQTIEEAYPIQVNFDDRPAFLAEFARQTELARQFRALVLVYHQHIGDVQRQQKER